MADTRLIDQELEDLARQRTNIITQAPILGFVPNPGNQLPFIEHDVAKCKCMTGDNQQGKTCLICVEAICHSWGFRPFMPKDDPAYIVRMPDGKRIPVPNIGMIAAADFPVGIGENLWPELQKWLPKGSYEVVKHERAIPRVIHIDISWLPWADRNDPNYPNSVMYVHAHQQGRESFQAVKCHWVLNDEPSPKSIFHEQMRALVRYGGKWMGGMTCVDGQQQYIYDIFDPPKRQKHDEFAEYRKGNFFLVEGRITDNLKKSDGSGALEIDNIKAYEAALDDPLIRAIRVGGKRMSAIGTEYGHIWDDDLHVVPHREPDPDSAFMVCCDAHPNKAYAVLFFEVNEHDEWYAWAELYDDKLETIGDIADAIKATECWKIRDIQKPGGAQESVWILDSGDFEAQYRLIDPLADSPERTTGRTAIEEFALAHLYWTKWMRGNKANRVREVKGWLRRGTGPRARPKLTFSERCIETIYQMPRYRRVPLKHPELQPDKGEMLDVDADLVQCVIAAASSGMTFDILDSMRKKRVRRDRYDTSRRDRPRAGYGNLRRTDRIYTETEKVF